MIFKLTLHLPRVRVACKPAPSAQQVPTVRSCRRPRSIACLLEAAQRNAWTHSCPRWAAAAQDTEGPESLCVAAHWPHSR